MKAIFLDRDGVLNIERGQYTYAIDDFEIVPGIIPALHQLKNNGFIFIVITNQAGIAKGLYGMEQMKQCHEKFQKLSDQIIEEFYIAPDHPSISESLSRKPDSLLFEKAMAKYDIDPLQSWMVGDKERDLIPAKKMGLNTILLGDVQSSYADYRIKNAAEMISLIL